MGMQYIDFVLEKGKTPIVWEGFAKEYNDRISKDVIMAGWESIYQTSDNFIVALNTLNIEAIPKNIKHNANAKVSKHKRKLKLSSRLNS